MQLEGKSVVFFVCDQVMMQSINLLQLKRQNQTLTEP